MSTALLIDRDLDPLLQPRLAQGTAQAALALATWDGAGAPPDPAPALVIAALPRGERRLPAALAPLIDGLFPRTPLLLISAEPLVQPYVLLAGGRLTLLGPPLPTTLIAERCAAAARWRPDSASGRAERQDGRGWGTVLATGHASLPLLAGGDGQGLTALLAGGTADGGAELVRSVLPALAAWDGQTGSDLLTRLLTRPGEGRGALIHLDAPGRRWLVAGGTAGGLLALWSPARLPTWYEFPPDGLGLHQGLAAEPGDVLLATSPLPDDEAFAPAALAAAAAGGARALAAHLATHGGRLGAGLAGAVLEVVS